MEQETSMRTPPTQGVLSPTFNSHPHKFFYGILRPDKQTWSLLSVTKQNRHAPDKFYSEQERRETKIMYFIKTSHLFSEQKSWGIHCPFIAFQKYSKAALSQQKQNFKIYFISMNFQLGGTRSNWFLCRQKQSLWNFLSWSYYTSITDSIFCPRVGGYMGSCYRVSCFSKAGLSLLCCRSLAQNNTDSSITRKRD